MTNDDWEELRTYAINFILDKTKAEIGGDAKNDTAIERLKRRYQQETQHTEGHRAMFKTAVINMVIYGPPN